MRLLAFLALGAVLPASLYACSDDDKPLAIPTDAGGDVRSPGDANTTTPETGPRPDATPPIEAGPDGAIDGGSDGGRDAAPDATPPSYLCKQAEFDTTCTAVGGDCTSLSRVDITFPMDILPEQYTHHCVKVKVGTQVVFAGKFSLHNLHAEGGDMPSPIPTQTTDPPVGDSGAPELFVPMTTPNKYYGFECMQHPTVMFGAIEVVP